MNIAVDCLPVFRACPNTGQAGPEHYGTIHLGTDRWAWRKDMSISLFNVVSAVHSSVAYFVAAGVCKISFHGSSSLALTHHLRGQGHASCKVGLIYLKLYHILCSMDEIDIAYREAMQGRASSRPIIEMTIPSVLDRTIAPPG